MTKCDLISSLSDDRARTSFLLCCGARRWAEQMIARRPFQSDADLLAAAAGVFRGLSREDWLEAFAAHPKIGDMKSLRDRFSKSTWSAQEQGGVAGASDETLRLLAEGNREYEARFGYIFIVCATGKSADEMLSLLQARLGNNPDAELKIAAAEQEKITHLRLEKLTP